MSTYSHPQIFGISFSIFLSLIGSAKAHDHHETPANPAGELDALILIHIGVQFLVWCIFFPIGLILGFVRARLHVPLQATSFVLTIGGYVLGHKHGGRTFSPSLHAELASIIITPICLQIILGTYLKLHINEGTRFRYWAVIAHRIVGLSYPVLGWTQALFGILVLGNICPLEGDHVYSSSLTCAEPFLTGTALMQYGAYSFLLTLALPRWKDQSPETWDSIILCITGLVCGYLNFWRLGAIWIGLVWSVGGIASFILSRNGRRTILPSIIVILTGFVKIFTPSETMNTTVKSLFGATLVLAGVKRALEIYIVSKNPIEDPTWSSLVPILFISAGMTYMTSSQDLVKLLGFDTVYAPSYLGFMLGLSMAAGAFVLFLGYLYRTSGRAHQATYTPREREERLQHTKVFAIEDSDEEDQDQDQMDPMLRGRDAYELERPGPARTFDSDEENDR